jgi:hypothetical protein
MFCALEDATKNAFCKTGGNWKKYPKTKLTYPYFLKSLIDLRHPHTKDEDKSTKQ